MWSTGKVSELCEIEYGTRVVKKRDQGTTYPVYGGGGATFSIDSANRKDRTIVSRFGMSEECVRHVQGDFFLNDSGLTLSPKLESLSQDFLDKAILGLSASIYKLGRGTAQKNLDMGGFKNLLISFPPLAEQQRIVAKLDAAFAEIDRAIELSNEKGEQSRLILQRVIDDAFAFDCKTVSFDSIVKEKGTGLERRAKLQSADKDYPYLKMNNISSANTLDVDVFTAVDASDDEVAKYTLNDGDFLFNTRNSVELVGKTAVVRGIEGWLFNNNILRVKFSESFSSDYVNDFFSSSEGKSQLANRKTGTTNVAAIYYKDLKTIEIPIAGTKEQHEIIAKIATARALTASLRHTFSEKAEHLRALKSSILAQELQPPQSDAA